MAYSLQNTTSLASLADAIRAKSGETANMTVEEMITAVNSISTGGGSGSGFMKRKEFYETSKADGVAGEIIHGSYVDVDTGLPEGSEFLFIFTTPTFSGTSSGTENAVAYVAYYDGSNFHRLSEISTSGYHITHIKSITYPITFEVNYDSTTGTNILRINNNGSSYYYDLNLGECGYDASKPLRYVWGNLFYLENFATKRLVFSRANGDYSYAFACQPTGTNENGTLFDALIDAISIENVGRGSYMFFNMKKVARFPAINFMTLTTTGMTFQCNQMFSGCDAMENPPTLVFTGPKPIINGQKMFQNCQNLTEIPDDYFDDWDDNSTIEGIFSYCCRLSKVPDMSRFRYDNTNNKSIFINTALEEIANYPVYAGTLTSNSFVGDANGYVAMGCGKLREFTFATNNGTPYVVEWKNQLIKMGITWAHNWTYGRYPEDIYPASKAVYDNTSYAALKNTDDWYANYKEYSRYNHDSMVRTLNSLPDASAYLATAEGTNTIQFQSATADRTDEGGVSNLTPEEIAVATAKGWTVSVA